MSLATKQRWIDLLSYAAVAAAFWILAHGVIRNVCSPVVRVWGGIPLWELAGSLGLLTVVILWRAGRGRLLGFLGVENFYAYPPLWLAVALGWLGVSFFDANVEAAYPRYFIALGAVSVLFSIVVRVLRPKRKSTESGGPGSAPESTENSIASTAALLQWLSHDREIDDPALDHFRHEAVVRRIARRLANGQEEEAPTIALVGPVGSGKSSIRALVQRHLENERRLRVIDVSLWPFESSEAATAGILSALVKELSRHVNTMAISGLPDRYLAVVERIGGPWQAIGRLLQQDVGPQAILKQFSDIAEAIGLRVVLWIEDLERFSGEEPEGGTQADSADGERVGPIRALLYLLDRCPSISVVLAATSLRARFDINKIARFVESPPMVETKQVWHVIRELRTSSLELSILGLPIIDPAHRSVRQQMEPDDSVLDLSSTFWRSGPEKPGFHEALALLLRTPRAVKDALRQTHDIWNVLAGEIDLDDVLVMSVIKAARPRVFAFVGENIDDFRRGFRGRDRDRKRTEHPKYKELETLLKIEETVEQQNAILAMLSFVFPIPDAQVQYDTDRRCLEKPQGLVVARPVDYWRRYLAVPEIDPQESDQGALRAIEDWRARKSNSLVERLNDPNQHSRIELFQRPFTGEDLIRLLEEVVESQHGKDVGHRWPSADAGITSVWRMMNDRPPDSAALTRSVLRLIETLVADNLPLVHELVARIAGPKSPNVPILLRDDETSKVHSAVHEQLKLHFPSGTVEKLVEAIRDGTPDLVYRLCWGAHANLANKDGRLPFEGWSAFSDVLLEAAGSNPPIGVAQILWFVTATKPEDSGRTDEDGTVRRSRVWIASFAEGHAKRLFNIERLLRILRESAPDFAYLARARSDGTTDRSFRDDVEERFRAAREFAEQHAEQGSSD